MKTGGYRRRVTHLLPAKQGMAYLVHQYISTIGYPVRPLEISQKLNLNPDSVRSLLSKMVSKGLLSRPSYGFYALSPTHGLGVSRGGVRVQNLVVVAEGVPVLVSDGVVVGIRDLVSVRVSFGVKRGRVSYHVGVPLGLDLVGLVLIHHVVLGEVSARGYCVPDEAWMVRNVEFLTDYGGFRLEGFEGCTFWGMVGELEKYYNRTGVRREVRASPVGVRLGELRALLEGGVDAAQVHRRLNLLEEELREVKGSVKGLARMTFRGVKLNEAILDAFIDARERAETSQTRIEARRDT